MKPQRELEVETLHDEPRFDVYTVVPDRDNDFAITKMGKNLDTLAAVALSGVHHHDFEQSVIYTGWVGTCPDWTFCLPVVTIPTRVRLGFEQLEFIAEQCGPV